MNRFTVKSDFWELRFTKQFNACPNAMAVVSVHWTSRLNLRTVALTVSAPCGHLWNRFRDTDGLTLIAWRKGRYVIRRSSSVHVMTLEPWMSDSLIAALVAVGCPQVTATHLASRARIDPLEDTGPLEDEDEDEDEDDLRTLMLCGFGGSIDDHPGDYAAWDGAVELVADNIANENAEANDRLKRGETDSTPYWPLPERPARRGR